MKTTSANIANSRLGLFINGEYVPAHSDAFCASYDPTTGKSWYEFSVADEMDVDRAVCAARAALVHPVWRQLTPTERGKLVRRLGELVQVNASELALLECKDNGKLLREMIAQAQAIPDSYFYFAGMADKLQGETIPVNKRDTLNFNLREPIGVVAMIIPWNSPLMMLTGTLAPCLAIGNTVVAKPSEHATASTLALAELAIEAGIPPGVFNVVTGDGQTTGEALTSHPGIAKLVFTGSTATGRRIASNAAQNLIPCQMELGGKSPHVIFGDADVERAVNGVMAGVFAAAGQTCVAGSRCLVETGVYDEFIAALVERTRRIRIGHPMHEDTDIGPLALAAQLQKVQFYVASGQQEGAKVAIGGAKPQRSDLQDGWYFEPTVMTHARNDMRFMQEEIFGPVVGVMPFSTEPELIELANGTDYGLASGIWTRDISRAMRFIKNIDAGTVWVNTYRSAAYMSANGGIKHSGYGRRGGFEVMREFSRLKNVVIDYSEAMQDPFVIRLR